MTWWSDLPKKVALSVAVLTGVLVLFLALFFTLGTTRDDAVAENLRLKQELQKTKSSLDLSQQDYEFVVQGKERYEQLLSSTKLIPHARRAAVRQLQQLGTQNGLSTLNYQFNASSVVSPTAVLNQPKTGDYRVSVESIKLNIGAPLDGDVFKFMRDIVTDFPGSNVIESFKLERAPVVTTEALNSVWSGRESRLVTGEIIVSWRTAQRVDESDTNANKGR
ncbi:MAG: hypothetical protein KDE14_12915 [Rhodobacteraceae bacterium]|nr:hypothetical protein [Paracoccaceae bacterium]